MTLDHHPEQAPVALGNLLTHFFTNLHLAVILLQTVGMTEIDHDVWRQARAFQRIRHMLHTHRVIVGPVVAAAQDDVTIGIAGGGKNGGMSSLGQRQEMMGSVCGMDGVDGDLHAPIGGILETDRTGQSGSQLPVYLAFGGPRTDGPPGNQVRDVLR